MENYYGFEASANSKRRNLKLIFSTEVASPVFTKENITGKPDGNGGNSIKVLLVDSNTQQKITTGQVASARVKIVLLRGNLGHVSSSLEFEKNIVVEWFKKKNLLLGDLYVDLKDGCGTVGSIRIKHDKNPLSNVKFCLGAMVVDCPFIVKEAITGPFEVKDQRNAPKSKRPLSLEDNVGQLMNISRNGIIRKRLARNNVWIVKDFLDRHSSNAQELQMICGIKGKSWKTTVDHAKTCLIKNSRNAKTRVESTYPQLKNLPTHDCDGGNEFGNNCYKPKPYDENDVFGKMMIMDHDFSIDEVEQCDVWFPYHGYQEDSMIGASICFKRKCVKAKKIWMKLRSLWFTMASFMKKDGSSVAVTLGP